MISCCSSSTARIGATQSVDSSTARSPHCAIGRVPGWDSAADSLMLRAAVAKLRAELLHPAQRVHRGEPAGGRTFVVVGHDYLLPTSSSDCSHNRRATVAVTLRVVGSPAESL